LLPLDLNCPLVVLDVETTGTHPQVDRVCQIGLVKVYPDGKQTEWETLVNPTVPIPPEVSKVHGITDEKVVEAPTFEDLWMKLAAGLSGCDFAGYNVTFDLRILTEEFKRVRARPEQILNGRVLDGYKIMLRHEPRTLSAALKFYCQEEHDGAHDALLDVKATIRVLAAQLALYNLPRDMETLHRTYFETPAEGHVDADGKFVLRHGAIVLNFSKHAGTALSKVENGFLTWMLKGDFSPSTKAIVKEELARRG